MVLQSFGLDGGHFYRFPAEYVPLKSEFFTKNVNEWPIEILKIIKNVSGIEGSGPQTSANLYPCHSW